ncbi:MAG: NifB/NifX family molybdenum-iron cluster-binding protein [Actinobacteria bacterium]|nr:NifB/NifX family molybdenum-iron cluster-binding protein [Actinomycetota bacterium]
MKVAISSSGTDLGSNVDPRFGRCPYFIIYDTSNDNFEVVNNQGRQAMGGAGIQAAQLVIDSKADAVISGNIGPNSYHVFSSASIKVYSGVSGTIEEAINKLKKGELKETSSPDVSSHFGTGPNWNN